MRVLSRLLVSTALAVGALAAAGGIAVVVHGPRDRLDVLLVATAVAFLSTGLVGAASLRVNPTNRVGWILLLAGAALPVSTLCTAVADAAFIHHAAWVPIPRATALIGSVISVFGVPLIATLGLLLFPDGRFADSPDGSTRLARALAVVCIADLAALAAWAFLSPTLLGTNASEVESPIGIAAGDALVVAIVALAPISALTAGHLFKRARAARGDESRPLRVVAVVSFAIPLAFAACVAIGMSGGNTSDVAVAENVAAIVIAASAWVAVVRYGLFDTRAVLSKSLVYGTVTVAVIGTYVAVAAAAELVVAGRAPAVAGATLGALLALPLRDMVQRHANRLVYGLRDDPAAAFRLLGLRLEAAAAPDELLPVALRAVGEALRLRHVAVEVGDQVVGAWGTRVAGRIEAVDLPFAGEMIGRVVLQAPDASSSLQASQRALLEPLVAPLGIAARAVALTHALEVSRERLVAAVGEERRRLRRDLHDGIGTTLAGIALGIDSARRTLNGASAETAELLAGLRKEAEQAVRDVRRIVYDLRPPLLDELGLAAAIHEQARRLGCATVQIPAALPMLPSAVEVAAYRIAVEAMANAARHAPGEPIEVAVTVDGGLRLLVSDTGHGVPSTFTAGVGIASMRERAAECGGKLTLMRREPRGTTVEARLPLEIGS